METSSKAAVDHIWHAASPVVTAAQATVQATLLPPVSARSDWAEGRDGNLTSVNDVPGPWLRNWVEFQVDARINQALRELVSSGGLGWANTGAARGRGNATEATEAHLNAVSEAQRRLEHEVGSISSAQAGILGLVEGLSADLAERLNEQVARLEGRQASDLEELQVMVDDVRRWHAEGVQRQEAAADELRRHVGDTAAHREELRRLQGEVHRHDRVLTDFRDREVAPPQPTAAPMTISAERLEARFLQWRGELSARIDKEIHAVALATESDANEASARMDRLEKELSFQAASREKLEISVKQFDRSLATSAEARGGLDARLVAAEREMNSLRDGRSGLETRVNVVERGLGAAQEALSGTETCVRRFGHELACALQALGGFEGRLEAAQREAAKVVQVQSEMAASFAHMETTYMDACRSDRLEDCTKRLESLERELPNMARAQTDTASCIAGLESAQLRSFQEFERRLDDCAAHLSKNLENSRERDHAVAAERERADTARERRLDEWAARLDVLRQEVGGLAQSHSQTTTCVQRLEIAHADALKDVEVAQTRRHEEGMAHMASRLNSLHERADDLSHRVEEGYNRLQNHVEESARQSDLAHAKRLEARLNVTQREFSSMAKAHQDIATCIARLEASHADGLQELEEGHKNRLEEHSKQVSQCVRELQEECFRQGEGSQNARFEEYAGRLDITQREFAALAAAQGDIASCIARLEASQAVGLRELEEKHDKRFDETVSAVAARVQELHERDSAHARRVQELHERDSAHARRVEDCTAQLRNFEGAHARRIEETVTHLRSHVEEHVAREMEQRDRRLQERDALNGQRVDDCLARVADLRQQLEIAKQIQMQQSQQVGGSPGAPAESSGGCSTEVAGQIRSCEQDVQALAVSQGLLRTQLEALQQELTNAIEGWEKIEGRFADLHNEVEANASTCTGLDRRVEDLRSREQRTKPHLEDVMRRLRDLQTEVRGANGVEQRFAQQAEDLEFRIERCQRDILMRVEASQTELEREISAAQKRAVGELRVEVRTALRNEAATVAALDEQVWLTDQRLGQRIDEVARQAQLQPQQPRSPLPEATPSQDLSMSKAEGASQEVSDLLASPESSFAGLEHENEDEVVHDRSSRPPGHGLVEQHAAGHGSGRSSRSLSPGAPPVPRGACRGLGGSDDVSPSPCLRAEASPATLNASNTVRRRVSWSDGGGEQASPLSVPSPGTAPATSSLAASETGVPLERRAWGGASGVAVGEWTPSRTPSPRPGPISSRAEYLVSQQQRQGAAADGAATKTADGADGTSRGSLWASMAPGGGWTGGGEDVSGGAATLAGMGMARVTAEKLTKKVSRPISSRAEELVQRDNCVTDGSGNGSGSFASGLSSGVSLGMKQADSGGVLGVCGGIGDSVAARVAAEALAERGMGACGGTAAIAREVSRGGGCLEVSDLDEGVSDADESMMENTHLEEAGNDEGEEEAEEEESLQDLCRKLRGAERGLLVRLP
eukprot:TRINITY_DN7409_c0_g1_i1.p1 TRINITY_DN7409_c0_g1~~TRINITY_DN7409_c0_g1_i1.p1  ORF type:complete len:1487 (-),score=348.93 TRINITY_DN7409_c0_g1_i1:36-4496(-)